MDPEFREIYSEQIEWYSRTLLHSERWWPDFELRTLAIATEAIEEAVRTLPYDLSLRPDARLFLLINLHQIVTMPLADRRSPIDLSVEVENGIKSDVKMILNASIEYAAESRRREIAASHVVWGLASVLNELSLKSWRLWETDE